MRTMRKTPIMALSSFILLAVSCHAQTPDASSKQGDLTELSITQTPKIRALCLPGVGDSTAYSGSMTKLLQYANENSIDAKGFAFGDKWKAGSNPDNPAIGATWEVCVESSAPDSAASGPFVFRDLEPQDAAYGTCAIAPEDLSKCFAGLETFVQSKNYHPVAMPRYKLKPVDKKNNKNVYEIWLPVAATSNSQTEQAK